MKGSVTNERSRRNQQDAKTKVEESGFLENELLPLRFHVRRPAGSNFNQRSQNKQSHRRKRNDYIEMDTTRRSPHVHSWGLRFQPGNGDLNRRGPIPELEPLPRRNHLLPPLLRHAPQQDFDGAVISDEEDDGEEEHEYLPNNARSRNRNGAVHLVSEYD